MSTEQGAAAGACVAVEAALARLREPEMLADLAEDCPRAPKLLAELSSSLQLALGRVSEDVAPPPRIRVLAVRNGFDPASPAARALRDACDLRVPGSPYIAETGNEDVGGKGEEEMVDLLRLHLRTQPVDLVVAQSRGCRLLVQHIIGGDDPCWAGPVLALSPAGEWGAALASSEVYEGRMLIAFSGRDMIELGGAHPVLTRSDVDAISLAVDASQAQGARRLCYEEERRGGWAESVVAMALDVALSA